MQDVGFAERRESAVKHSFWNSSRRCRPAWRAPEVEAKLVERRAVVDARNKREAEKEEARRQEEERLAAIRAAEEAKLEAEREAKREEERLRLEAQQAAEERRREAEKARLAASPSARAARALAELTGSRNKRSEPTRKAS